MFKWRWAPAVGRALLAGGDSCRESLGGRIASCRGIKVEAGPARGRVQLEGGPAVKRVQQEGGGSRKG